MPGFGYSSKRQVAGTTTRPRDYFRISLGEIPRTRGIVTNDPCVLVEQYQDLSPAMSTTSCASCSMRGEASPIRRR